MIYNKHLFRLGGISAMFISQFYFSQNVEQIRKIQQHTDVTELKKFSRELLKSTPSVQELKAKAKKMNVPFSGEINGKYFQFYSVDKRTGLPIYLKTYNVGAAAGTQTNKLHSGEYNLTGEGMTVHEWDGGGVRTTHREFGGRVTQKDVPSALSEHSTHVAGTMVAAGVNQSARGMAYKAKLNAYDWNSDTNEMAAAATDGALVSNHSYGFLGGFEYGNFAGGNKVGWYWFGDEDDTEFYGYGQYGSTDKNWDILAYRAPYYLPVKAAGNPRGDGPRPGESYYVNTGRDAQGNTIWTTSNKPKQKNGGDDGFDCIVTGSLAKNILTVGAAEKLKGEYSKPSDVEMASFSAFGPTDDGRIKPDITGIGVDLFSTTSTGDASYTTLSGTSMASPNVTGTLILLQQHYSQNNNGTFMKSATLKGLAIATANEAGNAPGPDYASGWGLLNAYKAANTISLNGIYSLIEENKLENNKTYSKDVIASGTEPLKVTIVWTDPAPVTLSDEEKLNDRTKMLVNDLDIRVTENGKTYFPWVLNPERPGDAATTGDNIVDNVEQVYIPNPTPGATYTITVTHKGTLKKPSSRAGYSLDDAESQDFSMIITGINLGEIKYDLSLNKIELGVPKNEFSERTPVNFKIYNIGKEKATGAKLTYKLINEDTNAVVSTSEIPLEDLEPGALIDKTGYIDLSKSFVNYRIEGEIVYPEDRIKTNNYSNIKTFGVVSDLTVADARDDFGFEGDFIQNGWTSQDVDGDGITWRSFVNSRYSHGGSTIAVDYPDTKTPINNWLFSNPIKFSPETLYRVTFYVRKVTDKEEYLKLAIGNRADAGAMTYITPETIEAKDGQYTKYSYEFKIPGSTEGTYYIGFQHKQDEGSFAVLLDDVSVHHSERKPEADFTADNTYPSTYDVVSLKDETITASTLPIIKYQWKIEPSYYEYVDNTNASSQNPKVRFQKERSYTITLKATNAKGADSRMKEVYIRVKNKKTVADFTTDDTQYYQKDEVLFNNTSSGNPKPNSFKWEITPSDGVEYTQGTNASSENPVVKFNQPGTYSVKLTATSPMNESTVAKTDYLTVNSIYNPVRNLSYKVEDNQLKLKWDRPMLAPIYSEKFNGKALPSDMKIIDNDDDGITWVLAGEQHAVGSSSWENAAAVEKDDWLITPALKKGAEVVKFDVRHPRKERYEVYVMPASAGELTADDILSKGHKVFSEEAVTTNPSFKQLSADVHQYTGEDFYVAFRHNSKATDPDSSYLMLDNISVGYSDNPLEKGMNTSAPLAHSDNKKTMGIIEKPELIGYFVRKEGSEVADIDGKNNLVYTESNLKRGVYHYDVRAKYSDGTFAEQRETVVDLSHLATYETQVNNQEVAVYPNPSEGIFFVNIPSHLGKEVSVSVYSASGEQVLNAKITKEHNKIDLIRFPKGVYLVKVNGTKSSIKIIVK
ncbi:T9SS-dependent choice-of-anchor J family protein [Riemerella columbipharyngis]|uniref:Por secretion system C-terminal sorting domain-containing protein n=1 Tax=Riemerella columbipharyngis TaxID=1071918 RepID=A0A1G7DY18_9FLAO|nr:choice-of-anchor J domain-containing protein [Riemerella columbipharyngis]SDE56369.1 Por secretion system C-terminal sorting domain-containing protein [Riemerella columbipharyngis]